MTQASLDGYVPRVLLSNAELRARGWTKSMVDSLLGSPDELRPNPVHPSWPAMHLFAARRVEQVEGTVAFKRLAARAAWRVASGKKSVVTKLANAMAWAMEVKVVVVHRGDVVERAVRHYNARAMDRRMDGRGPEFWEPATLDSSQAFLDRITVNYVRHQMTNYEDLLTARFGRVGVEAARECVRVRVYEAIGKAYPALAGECSRQLARRR